MNLAREGKLDELLLGLAKRQDAADMIEYERAVAAYNYRTDHEKAPWSECENAGRMEAGESPSYEANLVSSIVLLCQEQRLKAIMAERRKVETHGDN